MSDEPHTWPTNITKPILCAEADMTGTTFDEIADQAGVPVKNEERGEIPESWWRSTVKELANELHTVGTALDAAREKHPDIPLL